MPDCSHIAPFYLVYFSEDKTVSVIRAGAVLESSNSTLDVGGACRVREKGKVYHGIVVTYGEHTRVQHIHVV